MKISGKKIARGNVSQEAIVFGLSILLFVAFSAGIQGFLTPSNLLNLMRNVSILGVLGVGMAIVVIGRGIDLSIVAIYAMMSAWTFQMAADGVPLGLAMAAGLGGAILTGAITGFLVAYVEIPTIFATLAMGTLLYGFVRVFLIDLDVVYLTDTADILAFLGSGRFFGIPAPVIVFALACLMAWGCLKYTRSGQFIFALGDNIQAGRITGIPVRPIVVLQYCISALIAYVAGIVMAASVDSVNTRVAISTMVYDIILIVVIGGIGLSGGRGNVRNVIVGTLLIGILLNGMTIMNVQYTIQNIIKSILLLIAIVVDSVLNPRDEQTAQQGDI